MDREDGNRKSQEEMMKSRQEAVERIKSSPYSLGLGAIETTLHDKINIYKRKAKELEAYLLENPDDWGKFQNEFNIEMNYIFRDIMNFEKTCLSKNQPERVKKLKSFFLKNLRHLFVRGDYSKWTVEKPLGYAGDYQIIDYIYQNNPKTTGYHRLFDNYYQMTAMCVAVRNRKEDFKRLILNYVRDNPKKQISILNLGCGACTDVKELLDLFKENNINKKIVFDCYDNEKKAIECAKEKLKKYKKVNLVKVNPLRLIVAKKISRVFPRQYDLIYATGVFDYFERKLAVKLISNLRKALNKDGRLIVSNVRDKYSNPTFHYMDWAGEWELIYRTDEEFFDIFLEAGFREEELKTQYEQQGIMQYIIAHNIVDGREY